MSERNDGGAAFPLNTANMGGSGACFPDPGMSLRDYYAAHAPDMPDQWWLDTKAQYGGRVGAYAEAIAAWRYFYADAMLAARDGQP